MAGASDDRRASHLSAFASAAAASPSACSRSEISAVFARRGDPGRGDAALLCSVTADSRPAHRACWQLRSARRCPASRPDRRRSRACCSNASGSSRRRFRAARVAASTAPSPSAMSTASAGVRSSRQATRCSAASRADAAGARPLRARGAISESRQGGRGGEERRHQRRDHVRCARAAPRPARDRGAASRQAPTSTRPLIKAARRGRFEASACAIAR